MINGFKAYTETGRLRRNLPVDVLRHIKTLEGCIEEASRLALKASSRGKTASQEYYQNKVKNWSAEIAKLRTPEML
jgi:phage host-nuclease inhibitor protein Gam